MKSYRNHISRPLSNGPSASTSDDMNLQVTCSFLFLASLANAQFQPQTLIYDATEYGSSLQQHTHEESDPAEYNYSYDVSDDITGDRKSQQESRYGDQVRGRYSLLDADGSTRTVEYSVDSGSGFNAIVRRDGQQITLPNLVYGAGPMYGDRSANPAFTDIFRGDSPVSEARTRLAQDARTGNVVDLRSGFGLLPGAISDSRQVQSPHFARDDAQSFRIPDNRRNVEGYGGHDDRASHPTNHHLSRAPVHFPNHDSRAYPSRSELAYNRYSIRPVEVRRPTALFRAADNARPGNSDVGNNQNYNETVSTTPYPNVERPGPHGEFNHRIANTNVEGAHGSVNSRIALYEHRPTFRGEIDAFSDRNRAVFASELQRSRSSTDSEADRRYLYPASTIPLDARTPAHFFADEGLTGGVSPLLNAADFDVHNSFFNHLVVEPVHQAVEAL